MTTEERLSSAERHIVGLQEQVSSLAQGQAAHEAILDRMSEVLERLTIAYVDTSNRLSRMEDRQGLIEERIGLMEDRQGRMEERVERMEVVQQDHTRILQAHSVELAAIRAILERNENGQGP